MRLFKMRNPYLLSSKLLHLRLAAANKSKLVRLFCISMRFWINAKKNWIIRLLLSMSWCKVKISERCLRFCSLTFYRFSVNSTLKVKKAVNDANWVHMRAHVPKKCIQPTVAITTSTMWRQENSFLWSDAKRVSK